MENFKEKQAETQILCLGDFEDLVFQEIRKIAETRTPAIGWKENTVAEFDFKILDKMNHMDCLLIHRRNIGPSEIQTISAIRQRLEGSGPRRPRIELVLGDLARYSDVQTLAAMSDRITPEGIITEVLPFRLQRLRNQVPRSVSGNFPSKVGLLSQNRSLMEMLAEWIQFIGHQPVIVNGWSDPRISRSGLMIWDVPLLNSRWETELLNQTKRRPVITLMGMATRDLTEQARAAGAIGCLDLPFESDDLIDMIHHGLTFSDRHTGPVGQIEGHSQQTVVMRSGKTVIRAENGHPFASQSRHNRQQPDHEKSRNRNSY